MQDQGHFQWELEELSSNQLVLTGPIVSKMQIIHFGAMHVASSGYLSITGKGYLAGHAWQITKCKPTSRIDLGGRLAPGSSNPFILLTRLRA